MDQKFLYQNKTFIDRRRELRNNATETEKILWRFLKGSQLGVKFTRQYSAGPYILDFYCPKLRLAIELDGELHKEAEKVLYDRDRDKFLKSINIETIRFWNNEVVGDSEIVLKKIQEKISNMETPS